MTWVSQIKKDLENMNVSWTEVENICKNDKNVQLQFCHFYQQKVRQKSKTVGEIGKSGKNISEKSGLVG